MCELQHKETNVPDLSHFHALNLYTAPLMKILIFLRSGFASEMKGSLGSNPELLRSCNHVLCDAMWLGGLMQSVSMDACSQGRARKISILIEQVCQISVITPGDPVPG